MLKYLKKYWFYALIAPLFMIGEVTMDLLQPRLMSIIVDEGVLGLSSQNTGDLGLVLSTGLQMIGLVMAGGLCGILCGVFSNLCSQNFGNDLRKAVFRRILSFSFQQTDQFSTGSLITRVTNDVTQLENLVSQCIRGFVRSIMFFAGGIFFLLSLDFSFGVVAACAFPILLLCMVFFLTRVSPRFAVLQKKLDRVNSVLQENVTGSRVVKAYVREDYEKERFGRANRELVDTQLHILFLLSHMSPVMNMVLNLSVVAVIYVGSIRVRTAGVTPGSVMAAITYLTQILHSIMMFSMIFQTVSRGLASARRLNEILLCEPALKDGPQAAQEERIHTQNRGRIEFRNVSFSYPGGSGEAVLRRIDLTIEPGETLALLGATGSGKTSLVSLIPRFYDVDEGAVLVDGMDVREYRLSDLRNRIAIALQKSELFGTSIRENISWGRPDASFDEIRQAAEAAQAAEFIENRPEGYDTKVAEKGMSLSGGQKQRLSISRALLKQAEILIFDDSTSALDLKTEARLYEVLRSRYAHMTKIIIAQRIASVRGADRIAVIDNGSIAACGSHEELMAGSEIYRDIYRSQLESETETVRQDIRESNDRRDTL